MMRWSFSLMSRKNSGHSAGHCSGGMLTRQNGSSSRAAVIAIAIAIAIANWKPVRALRGERGARDELKTREET
jgi:hypothetical protein